jgi:heme exporter protein D
MNAIAEFFRMGGYAAFVWPAYAIGLVVLGGLAVASLRQLRAREREAAAMEAANPRRARRGAGAEGVPSGDA